MKELFIRICKDDYVCGSFFSTFVPRKGETIRYGYNVYIVEDVEYDFHGYEEEKLIINLICK